MTIDPSSTTGLDSPDYAEIVEAIDLYIGGFDGRIDKFKELFHPDARISFTTGDGLLVSMLISDLMEEWATYGHWERRILSVTQAGDVASVMLEMHQSKELESAMLAKYPGVPGQGNSWVDIHSLLRIDGKWTDMNKTATHSSRAGWAAPSV